MDSSNNCYVIQYRTSKQTSNFEKKREDMVKKEHFKNNTQGVLN